MAEKQYYALRKFIANGGKEFGIGSVVAASAIVGLENMLLKSKIISENQKDVTYVVPTKDVANSDLVPINFVNPSKLPVAEDFKGSVVLQDETETRIEDVSVVTPVVTEEDKGELITPEVDNGVTEEAAETVTEEAAETVTKRNRKTKEVE